MSNLRESPQFQIRMSETLQEAGKTGLFEIDLDNRRFLGSGACFKILGLNKKAGSANLSRILNLIHKKSEREKIEKYLIAPDITTDHFETEFKIRTQNGDEKKVKTVRMICCQPESGKEKRIQGFLRDISSEKKVEREVLKARYKAERANRFKSVFLTNLGHELRTPMNAIIGFSELLKSGRDAGQHLDDYLSIIKNKGNYLLSLIDDVIELSRFETGNVTIRKSSFNAGVFMADLYEEFRERRKEKDKEHIELELDIPDEYKNISIYTDPGRLHQVLASILSNAFKFTEKGKVEFGFFASAKNYKFYVSDTGIGLGKDDQRRIFNRFEEVEETALTRLAGTGLSLTIARKIIEQLGGKIKVRSELNKGSWFQITIPNELPEKPKADMTHQTWNIKDINWKDKVILIAEDEELNFKFLEALLQRTQAQVLRAKNGKEAVDLCKNISHIDMILMDIKMPVMSGNEATMEIKKDRPDLPVIAQTAFSIQEEISKCKEAGCDDYVTKPIDIKKLIQKMGYFLQK